MPRKKNRHLDEPRLPITAMLMALEEMPPLTGYMTGVLGGVNDADDADPLVVIRLDDSVGGAYALMIVGSDSKSITRIFANRDQFVLTLGMARTIGGWLTVDDALVDLMMQRIRIADREVRADNYDPSSGYSVMIDTETGVMAIVNSIEAAREAVPFMEHGIDE